MNKSPHFNKSKWDKSKWDVWSALRPIAVGAALMPIVFGSVVPAAAADEGATLYAASCAACHGAQGTGVPGVFPSLVADGAVNSTDPTKQISTILNGLRGARVGGITYASQMPAFAAQLSDLQVAAIVNYERTAWGNHAPPVVPQTVADLRAKH